MGSGFRGLAIMAAIVALPAPLAAQSIGSDRDKFLTALRDNNNNEAVALLEKTGDTALNYRGLDGNAPLHIVTRARKLSWIGFLLSKGADPNIADSRGDTPLILAARVGYADGASRLLAARAQVDKDNKLGETPLIVAVQQRQPALVRMLLEAGANPDKADHAAGYTARDYAKRDSRAAELLRLMDTVKAKKAATVGPQVR